MPQDAAYRVHKYFMSISIRKMRKYISPAYAINLYFLYNHLIFLSAVMIFMKNRLFSFSPADGDNKAVPD